MSAVLRKRTQAALSDHVPDPRQRALVTGPTSHLTRREEQLLRAMARNKSYQAIADEPGIPVGGVGPTRLHLLRKLRESPEATPPPNLARTWKPPCEPGAVPPHRHRHRRKLEWAWFGFRVASALLGFGALVVFALVAVQFIGHGAPVEAGVSLGAGAVSVVAIFVTGRAAGPLFAPRTPPDKE